MPAPRSNCAIILPSRSGEVGEPAASPVYESRSFVLRSDSVEQGGLSARVDPNTGGITSNGTDRGPDTRESWRPAHDVSGLPRFSSGYPIIDAVYRMALDDCLKCVGDEGALSAGGSFGVWVRDTAYATLLSTALVFPEATRRSLEATVIEGETVRPEQLYAVHEGIPYSMSDFVAWIPAAWEYAKTTGDLEFIERHYDEMVGTVELATREKFDPVDGLYTGGCSFFDGHNGYPVGTLGRNILKGTSTNVLHYAANMAVAEMGAVLEKSTDERFTYLRRAYAIKDAANDKLWLAARSFYAQLKVGGGRLEQRSEGLGQALAILAAVATRGRADRMLQSVPDSEWGIPSVWPIYGNRPLYHDQSVWPFVESFWALANAKMGDPDRLMKGIAALTRMAALELTFKELMRLYDGDGVGSNNQLWSAAGYLGLVLKGLFGLHAEPDGLIVSPVVPRAFAGGVSLLGLRYREARLDINVTGSGTNVVSFTLDGKSAINFVPATLEGRHNISVTMSEHSPFVEMRAPECMGLGKSFPVVVQHTLAEDLALALYARTGAAGKLTKLPATGGTGQRQAVTVDISETLSSLAESVVFAAALEDADGTVRALSRWRRVELRPPLEARFDPGAAVFQRPLEAGTTINLYLSLRNNIPEMANGSVRWLVPDGLKLGTAVRTAQAAPFTTGKVFATVYPAKELGYGRYTVKATVYSPKTPSAPAEIPIIISETIDLRGTWLMKKTDDKAAASPDIFDMDGSWRLVEVPGRWEDIEGYQDHDGPMWYRRHVLVPVEWAGYGIIFRARDIDDNDTTYLNGVRIGATEGFKKVRTYRIPAELVRPGEDNVIAIHVEDIGGEGGLRGWPIELEVTPRQEG